jgi:hypothetical protein
MQKKWWVVANVSFLIILVVVLIFVAYRFAIFEEEVREEECVDVHNVASFVYDACYDAYTEQIFIEVKRGFDIYNIKKMVFSFFDFSQKSYDVYDVPENKGAAYFKIPAEKNPQSLSIFLGIVKDFSAPICNDPREIFVRYCVEGIHQESINASISPLNGEDIGDFIEIGRSPSDDSDVLSTDLVEKERIWASQCESIWSCSSWGECADGIERRECKDSKECFIPTAVPDTARYCDGTCVEKWECEWSKCSNGYAVPECRDLNRCGTSYNIPKKLACDVRGSCTPDIVCEGWSECDIDYSFIDLVSGVQNLEGTRSRVCSDKNSCAEPSFETKNCSVGVDIYTRRMRKCGIEFIGIYNKLTNDLISRIDIGDVNNPHLNIDLDGGDQNYCDYCFDGVQNGDETGIDCGGSCEVCETKYVRTPYRKKGLFSKVGDWLREFFA